MGNGNTIDAREAYIAAIKDMLAATSLDRIRVSDICARTQTNRHTFYYHFRDKYELVCAVFSQMVEGVMGSDMSARIDAEKAAQMLHALKRDLPFYKNALKYTGQQSLNHFITHYVFQRLCANAARRLGVIELPEVPRYVLMYHACAMSGMLEGWVMRGADIPEEVFMRIVLSNLPSDIKQLYT